MAQGNSRSVQLSSIQAQAQAQNLKAILKPGFTKPFASISSISLIPILSTNPGNSSKT